LPLQLKRRREKIAVRYWQVHLELPGRYIGENAI
jgi:hypothetical protein